MKMINFMTEYSVKEMKNKILWVHTLTKCAAHACSYCHKTEG
jgi:hypothetical protein